VPQKLRSIRSFKYGSFVERGVQWELQSFERRGDASILFLSRHAFFLRQGAEYVAVHKNVKLSSSSFFSSEAPIVKIVKRKKAFLSPPFPSIRPPPTDLHPRPFHVSHANHNPQHNDHDRSREQGDAHHRETRRWETVVDEMVLDDEVSEASWEAREGGYKGGRR